MLQNEARVDVADNTGAKIAYIIRVEGGTTRSGRFTRRTASIGDKVMCAIKKALPSGEVKVGSKSKAVVVRTAKPVRRADGSYVKFDRSAVVLIDDEGNPKGTRIFGAVARELRDRNFMKIVSLAAEVV